MRNGIEVQVDLLDVDQKLAEKTVEINDLRTVKAKLEVEVAELRKANFEAQVKQQQEAEKLRADAIKNAEADKVNAIENAEADKPAL